MPDQAKFCHFGSALGHGHACLSDQNLIVQAAFKRHRQSLLTKFIKDSYRNSMFRSVLLISLFSQFSHAAKFDCTSLLLKPVIEQTIALTPTGDFPLRDSLPQTEKPIFQWLTCCGTYGPCAQPYPEVVFPQGIDNLAWSRIRVIEAAKKFIGLPYKHHHIPAMGGMDCSNFTAFVYNYALGKYFTSWVERQAEEVGRRLAPAESLLPGDLIFLFSKDFSRISHSVIYINPNEVIDSTGGGILIRPFGGWYKENFAWARRVIE